MNRIYYHNRRISTTLAHSSISKPILVKRQKVLENFLADKKYMEFEQHELMREILDRIEFIPLPEEYIDYHSR